MTARDELVAAIAGRYAQGDERGRILDEFAAVTGFHRKHAMRLLRAGQVNRRAGSAETLSRMMIRTPTVPFFAFLFEDSPAFGLPSISR